MQTGAARQSPGSFGVSVRNAERVFGVDFDLRFFFCIFAKVFEKGAKHLLCTPEYKNRL